MRGSHKMLERTDVLSACAQLTRPRSAAHHTTSRPTCTCTLFVYGLAAGAAEGGAATDADHGEHARRGRVVAQAARRVLAQGEHLPPPPSPSLIRWFCSSLISCFACVQLQYAQDELKAVRADLVDRESQISRLRIEVSEANERSQRSSTVRLGPLPVESSSTCQLDSILNSYFMGSTYASLLYIIQCYTQNIRQ